MKPALKYYRPAILWALFIFIMCSIKLGKIGGAPMFFPGFDKLVHCGFFFVLVVFCGTGLIKQLSPGTLSYTGLIVITLAAVFYGGLIELLQYFIFTWRSGDFADWFADGLGAAMGAFSIIITDNAVRYVKK